MYKKIVQILVIGSIVWLGNCASDLGMVGSPLKQNDLLTKVFDNKRGDTQYSYGQEILKVKDPANFEFLILKIAIKNNSPQSMKLNLFATQILFDYIDQTRPKDKPKPGTTVQSKMFFVGFLSELGGSLKSIGDPNNIYIVDLNPQEEIEREIIFTIPKTAKLKSMVFGKNANYTISL